MKAEELINRVSRRYDCPLFRLHKPEIVTKENAQYAIEMARKEEREKAIKALDIAIMAIFERNTHSVSMGELRVQFNKLLNE